MMKKIILTVAMLFGMVTTNIANEVHFSDRLNTEMSNIGKSQIFSFMNGRLGECLDLTLSDSVLVNKIYSEFYADFSSSLEINDEQKREKAAVRAIRHAVIGMRKNLDDKNYRNFLRELNLSMYNNGLLDISDKYCDKYGR